MLPWETSPGKIVFRLVDIYPVLKEFKVLLKFPYLSLTLGANTKKPGSFPDDAYESFLYVDKKKLVIVICLVLMCFSRSKPKHLLSAGTAAEKLSKKIRVKDHISLF